MTRTQAVARISQAIGFRPVGHPLEGAIINALQEAQRDLEKGKTLPKFLLLENQSLTLLAGDASVALPTGFLRESDETLIRFFPGLPSSTRPVFLQRRYFIDAAMGLADELDVPPASISHPPTVYVMRQSTINFITNSDQTYTLVWDYYKAADLLDTDVENAWLRHAPEWLWGEAGYRLAMDLVNAADLVTKFDAIRKMGRAAAFGEDLAAETASGPLQMGANL